MQRLTIKTHDKREILDITDRVEALLSEQYGGQSGVCHLVALHTTAALTTADLDPGTDADMLDAFEKIIPKLNYRHPHHPEHVPDQYCLRSSARLWGCSRIRVHLFWVPGSA
jgi:thiamine phosphate synthase YjbQ (UPF0047 family)